MNTKNNLINQINDAKENENFEDVIKFCEELEKIDQNNIDINYEKAFSYFKLKNFDKCIKYAEIFLKSSPDKERKALALGLIGGAYFEKEDFNKSLEYFDKKLKLTPDDETFKLMKAESLFEIGKYGESLKIARELNDFYLMAYCYFEMKEFEKSIIYFDILINSSQNIIEILDYKEMKAKALFAIKNYEEFTQLGEEILKLSPNKSFYYFMAVAYDKLGDKSNTVKYFKKAVEAKPDLMKDLIEFGERVQDKMYDENSVEDNLKWGHPYFEMERYDKALEYYLKACELDSENTEALKCVGEAYFKLKEYEKSFKYFKKALKTDEDNPDLLFGLAFISSVLAKPVDVIKYGNRILSKGDNIDIYQLIAMAYVDLDEKQSALELIDQAIYTHPQDNRFYTIKGNLYYYLGDEKNAAECFDKSIEMNPYDTNPYVNQIIYYKDHNNPEKSREIYERLIKNNPDFKVEFDDIKAKIL